MGVLPISAVCGVMLPRAGTEECESDNESESYCCRHSLKVFTCFSEESCFAALDQAMAVL
jgi:hypothetical protein